MKHVSKLLPAAFAVLLLGFSAAPCRAQNEGLLLHAGLLGYTGGIEDEAMLLSPAAIGQVFAGPARGGPLSASQSHSYPDWSAGLRLGSFSFKHDGIDDRLGSVLFFGLGATKNISDNFSLRGSVDFISDDSFSTGGFMWEEFDFSAISFKTTALIHPAAGAVGGSDSGYFNPHLGIGLELTFTDRSASLR